jgi:hypothetical protein
LSGDGENDYAKYTNTPSIPSVYAANAGLKLIEMLNPDAIRSRIDSLSRMRPRN